MSEYLAYVSVSKEDGEAIRDAGLVDARLGGVIEPGASEADFQPDDEPFDLVVRGVRGDHTPARVASARRVYAEIRNRLGLPPCEPRRIGVSPVEGLFDSPRHFALLELAERLRERGEAEFAVVAAQTASEIYVELAIVELLKGQVPVTLREAIPDLLPSYSFGNSRCRALFEALTGQAAQKAEFWPVYKDHLERRNRVVHRGETISVDAASASIVAVYALFNFVADAWIEAT